MGILCGCGVTATSNASPVNYLINGIAHSGTLTVDLSVCPSCLQRNDFVKVSYADNENADFDFSFTSQSVNLPSCEFLGEGNFATLNSIVKGNAVGTIINGAATVNVFAESEPDVVVFPTNQFFIGIDLEDENGNKFIQDSPIQRDSGEFDFCAFV